MRIFVHTLMIMFFSIRFGLCQTSEFVRRVANELVVGADNRPIWLHGMGVGNGAHYEDQDPKYLYANLSLQDYQEIAGLGMNVIRFNMNYVTFEDDASPYTYKQSGWDWLDINMDWARQTGVYLILCMANPQGGPQPGGEGLALWDNPENQNRLIALWTAIADRYKNESMIAAYDLLNEPTTSQSIDQWVDLAGDLIEAIRGVGDEHLIVIEPLAGVWGEWETDWDHPPNVFFMVNDSQVMTDFHFYKPLDYTHWFHHGELGHYPDPNVVYLPKDAERVYLSADNEKVPAGDSDWTYYEGGLYQVTESTLIAAMPVFVCSHNEGTVLFDDFVIQEFDADGSPVQILRNVDIVSETGWEAWQLEGIGQCEYNPTGHGGSGSLSIAGATGQGAGWIGWDNKFPVRTEHSYSISGWMKGEGVSTSAECVMRLDFIQSASGSPVMFRDKDYLEWELLRWSQFGRDNNLPVFVGEYGVDRDTFDGYGGLTWIEDVLDLFHKHGLHHTHHIWEVIRSFPNVLELFAQFYQNTDVASPINTKHQVRNFLMPNFPNPFNGETVVQFFISESCHVTVRVLNIQGQSVAILADEQLGIGQYSVPWLSVDSGGRPFPSGVYFIQMVAGNTVMQQKCLLLR